MEFEFVIDQTALDTVRGLSINANFEECEAAVTELVSPYAAMVVMADDLKGAKSDRARLRKLSDTIDTYRKAVKSEYTKPLAEFEEKCKRITGIIGTGISNLDAQVKAYDNEVKRQKLERLRTFFSDNLTDAIRDFADFESIQNQKWSNATYPEDVAQREILEALERMKTEVAAISGCDEEFRGAMLEEYRRTKSLTAAMGLQARLQARKKAEDAILAQRKAAEAARATTPPEQPAEQPTAPTAAPEAQEAQEAMYTIRFSVTGTQRQLVALKAYLRDSGITYGKA